tara:strand:+ start:88 stop:306 length:219 start_codon:yes stop_codon:yes gene_type:complete
MNHEIQPSYEELSVECSCGNKFKTRSTMKEMLKLDVCSECHPFYTGKQKIVDTAGRVDSFTKRFGSFAGRKV